MKSSDPLAPPEIRPNYLTNDEDVATLIRGIRFLRKMESTQTFQNELEFVPMRIPSCGAYSATEDRYWECYVRHMAGTAYHPIGTAKMGPGTDKTAVVDSRLKVHGGVEGVRVIDASIMPNMVSGNPNAAVIMIAEKGVDFIREDHGIKIKC